MGYDSTNRDPDVEKLLNELPENESSIYRFMRGRYEVLSNEGEVDSTEFDEQITKEAVEKFSISGEEVDKIYIDIEMKISQMHKKRLK